MKSHYPDFDVLDAQEEWDEHTKSVVLGRLQESTTQVFFDEYEAGILKSLCSTLLDDDRNDVLDYIVAWYDAKLDSALGEGEREANIPPEGKLVQAGLKALDTAAHVLYGRGVAELPPEVRAGLLRELQSGTIAADMKWASKIQQALFKKLLVNFTKAYYSHPTVWSEIGYAGPAYPRGYVRIECGLTDPWEARRND